MVNIMPAKTIRIYPDPILRRKTKRVLKIDKSILQLVEDMMDTLEESEGVGLAAPQVGVSLSIVVIWMPEEDPFAIINPEVVKRIGEREVEEGCLSIPGYQGKIKRAESVTVKGIDVEGKPLRIRAKELLSQALEHEIDHTNGILYIDHLESPDNLYKLEPRKADNQNVEKTEEVLVIGDIAPPECRGQSNNKGNIDVI
jgi:peptide deformylase